MRVFISQFEDSLAWCVHCKKDTPRIMADAEYIGVVCYECGRDPNEPPEIASEALHQTHYSGVYAAPQGERLYAAPIDPNGQAVESVMFTVTMEV